MKVILFVLLLGGILLNGCDRGSDDDFVPNNTEVVFAPNNVAEPGFTAESALPITIDVPAVDDSIQPNSDNTASNFVTNQSCVSCHFSNGTDVNTDSVTGEDVAPGTGWFATMMGNSMRDPYFRARLVSEMNRFPSQAALIQDECLRCHAPMLSEQNRIDNGPGSLLSFATASTSALARDGISCTSCHQIDDVDLENAFNGVLPFNTNLDIYGQYPAPAIAPGGMSGFNAVFSAHIGESRLCAGCHVLRTEVFAPNGTPTGNLFTEQATFVEYLNSSFPTGGTTCQNCHMPPINGGTQLAAGDPLRTPFSRHEFVGGNSIMLRLFRDNTALLGTIATPADFEQKIQETALNLASAANLGINVRIASGNRLQFDVDVQNLTGHKLPSGYPSRRMWLHVVVRKRTVGNILFESGRFDARGLIFGVDIGSIYERFEPHHDLITAQEQVQIYESVLGDTEQNITFSLHAANEYLKDNRLPPQGFLNSHPLISDMRIVGDASTDSDFNFENGIEGSGSDTVTYDIFPIDLTTGADILVELCFQAVGPAHVQDLRRFNVGEVTKFLNLFDATDTRPTIMASQTISTQ